MEKSQKEESDEGDTNSEAVSQNIQTDNQKAIEPELRKLQQVESARDPSRLIRAQMILQAQQKQPPKDTGKKW